MYGPEISDIVGNFKLQQSEIQRICGAAAQIARQHEAQQKLLRDWSATLDTSAYGAIGRIASEHRFGLELEKASSCSSGFAALVGSVHQIEAAATSALRGIQPNAAVAAAFESYSSLKHWRLTADKLATLGFDATAASRLFDASHIGFHALADPRFADRVAGFSATHTSLFAGLRARPGFFASMPEFVASLPLRDARVKGELLGTLKRNYRREQTVTTIDPPEADIAEIRRAVYEIKPAYAPWLDEALHEYRRPGPYRARRALAPLRNLYTELVRALSPNKLVLAWTSEANLLRPDKTPTNRARLLFICRQVDYEPYGAHVASSVELSESIRRSLNKAVHGTCEEIKQIQVELVFDDTLNLIRYILTATGHLSGYSGKES